MKLFNVNLISLFFLSTGCAAFHQHPAALVRRAQFVKLGESTASSSYADSVSLEEPDVNAKESLDNALPMPSSTSDGTAEKTVVDLLRVASACGRGEFATLQQKEQAEDLIQLLESSNPTDRPTQDKGKMIGTWDLLYSSTQLFRSSPFFMAGRAVCETSEQAKQYD